MIDIDMWYGDKSTEVDKLDIAFYPNEGKYRGNLYKDGKIIGDYVCDDSVSLEHKFPHLTFDWDTDNSKACKHQTSMRVVETRKLVKEELEGMCKEFHLYTQGTPENFNNLLSYSTKEHITTEDIVSIALDILEHSDMKVSDDALEAMCYSVSKRCLSFFKVVNE